MNGRGPGPAHSSLFAVAVGGLVIGCGGRLLALHLLSLVGLLGGSGERILGSLSLALDLDLGGDEFAIVNHNLGYSVDLGGGEVESLGDVGGEGGSVLGEELDDVLGDFGICLIVLRLGVPSLFVSGIEFGEFLVCLGDYLGGDVVVCDCLEKFSVSHFVFSFLSFGTIIIPYFLLFVKGFCEFF